MIAHLRSHTPFSCLLPSVTRLLSNTTASLKLTSQESSDSSPDGDNRRAREERENNLAQEESTINDMSCMSRCLTRLSVVKLFLTVHTERKKVTVLLNSHVLTIGLSLQPQTSETAKTPATARTSYTKQASQRLSTHSHAMTKKQQLSSSLSAALLPEELQRVFC